MSYYFSIVLLLILVGGYFRRFESEHRDVRNTAMRDSLTACSIMAPSTVYSIDTAPNADRTPIARLF